MIQTDKNLATTEKPTRRHASSVLFLSARRGTILGGNMGDNIGLIIVGAIIAVMVFLCPISASAADINMDIIKQIESSGNHLAHNKGEDARGLFQIRKPVLVEFNRMNNTGYSSNDLFIPVVNEKVATWYMNRRILQMLKHYGIKDTVENRLIAYNAGIGTLRKGIVPRGTRNYINRYNRMKGEIC